MADLDRRFREADRIPTHDLWTDIATRTPSLPAGASPTRRATIAVLVLAVVAVAIAYAAWAFLGEGRSRPADRPTAEVKNGRLAFVSKGIIVTTEPDGTSTMEVARRTGTRFTSVAWSPDGSSLAAIEAPASLGDSDPWSMIVMRADGRDARTILTIAGCDAARCFDAPTWSPDGSQLAFVFGTLPPSIAIRDFKGSAGGPDHFRGLPGSAGLTDPAWSPDGRRFAAVSPAGLWVLNADGSGKRRLAGCGANHPAWSPDGSLIVFACGSKSFYVIDSVGGAPQRIYQLDPRDRDTNGARQEALADPTWSPDGNLILFAMQLYYATLPPGWDGPPGSRWGLWTVRADGTGLRRTLGDRSPRSLRSPGSRSAADDRSAGRSRTQDGSHERCAGRCFSGR